MRLKRTDLWTVSSGAAIVCALVASLGFAGFVVMRPTPPPPQTEIRAHPSERPQHAVRYVARSVFIGDSWVGGSDMGGNGYDNFSELVAEHFHWTIDVSAVGGTGYLSRPTFGDPGRLSLLYSVRPDIVVVFNGVNDLDRTKHRRPIERLRVAAQQTYTAISQAIGPKAHVVVFGYVPPDGATKLFAEANAILELSARRHGFAFIDPNEDPWFDGPAHRLIGSDNFHPTDAGHRYLARLVERKLTALGAREWRRPAHHGPVNS